MKQLQAMRGMTEDEGALMSKEECDETHQGFTVICQACESDRVVFSNTLGFSALSGGWGEATLDCLECGAGVELISS